MRRDLRSVRLALILVPLLLSAALIGTLTATYLSVRGVLVTLVRGQGDAILDALSHQDAPMDLRFVETMLAEQREEGLRCIAVFDRAGEPRIVAGECLAEGAPALEAALAGSGPDAQEVGDRIRMSRGRPQPGVPATRDPVLVEFEPLMRRELELGALRNLGIGGVVSLALMGVALFLWRFSLRQERLEAAMERDRRLAALGEMAAVLAHEIRNPLASMKGHAQLLTERLAAETPEGEKAARVVREAVRLEELTSDLLAFIRSERIRREEEDPREMLVAAAADVGADRVDLEVGDAPDRWPVDPRLLQQALANLLRNAVQASPDGARASAAVAQEGDELVFRVRDHGEGVPPESRDRIFEPFFTTRSRGTGLGLAVARRIVELHGGAITVEDAAGGGALFRLTIPRI